MKDNRIQSRFIGLYKHVYNRNMPEYSFSQETGVFIHPQVASPHVFEFSSASSSDERGEESARHQIQESGLTGLHQSQGNECDHKSHTVCCE